MQFNDPTLVERRPRRPVGSIRGRSSPCRRIRLRCAVAAGASMLIAIAIGCAKRIPEPFGGHTDSPHLGWVIMSGDTDNADRDFVCQSNPRSECVVQVDRPDARVLAHVHIYYHSAVAETKYTGSIRLGFFDGPHEINPNITVKPGGSPGNQSVSDFVTSKPGIYTMTLAVVATSVPSGQPKEIREEVKVTMR